MFSTPLGRFRAIALTEGISFILLLAIAMPLKYVANLPIAVLIVGWIHGVLFMLYLGGLAHVAQHDRWSRRQVIFALIASVVPFGPFVFDARLRRDVSPLSDSGCAHPDG